MNDHTKRSSVDKAGTQVEDVDEILIRAVVSEFYRRALLDPQLGPVFDLHVDHWEEHLSRMTDFWSAVLLRTGRYAGRPMERHYAIDGLSLAHFDRWLELFEATVGDLCTPPQADAFRVRARAMREGMTRSLGLAAAGGN